MSLTPHLRYDADAQLSIKLYRDCLDKSDIHDVDGDVDAVVGFISISASASYCKPGFTCIVAYLSILLFLLLQVVLSQVNPFTSETISRTVIWSKEGDQGNRWHRDFVSVNSSVSYELSVVANLGPSFLSDMALDDISPTLGCQLGGKLLIC